MSRRARALVAAATLALAVAASARAAAPPLVVRTSLSPRSIYVADVVTARVDVFFERRRVDPASIRVRAAFGPWRQLDAVRLSSAGSSTVGRRTWSFTLACLSELCVPSPKVVRSFELPKLTVEAVAADGSGLRIHKGWPAIEIAGRFEPPKLHALVSLRTQAGVPAPTYRVSPTWLAWVLALLGGAIAALGLGLGAREVFRWRAARRRTVDTRSPLVRTLELVRQAQARQADDRRRAVGLLARVLPRDRGGLASAASEVAWSGPEPTPARLEEIARRVEAELEETS